MKIQQVTPEHHARVYALLRRAFPGSDYEVGLVQRFHQQGTPLHEWACLHTGKVIAYLAFSRAFHDNRECGLHLAPMAVAPEFQRQGIGAELLRFALRQAAIKSQPLFVLGEPRYYQKFGFVPCSLPICPFDQNNAHFLSLRHTPTVPFSIGYEPEFTTAARRPAPRGRQRR
jgi:putative acetyltransferase